MTRLGGGHQRPSGFTLMELLVVIAIMGVLFALGMLGFRKSSQSFKEAGAAMAVEAAIRQARNEALTQRAPAFVELDTQKRFPRVIPWGYRTVGLWHFEECGAEALGAFENNGIINGCFSAEGKIGRGLAFAGRGRGGQIWQGYVDCGATPDFDCPEGGYLEAYIYPYDFFKNTQYVFHKRNSYSLSVGAGGVLTGEVGAQRVEAEGYAIPPRRWTKVAFAWDRRSSRILVDDAVFGVGPGKKTPINEEPLLIGDENASFLGKIDEVKVMAAIAGKPVLLPFGTKLEHNAQPWNAIFFAPDGTLDIRYHTQPVTVDIIQHKKQRSVYVSMLGLTTRKKLRNLKAEAEKAEAGTAPPPPKPPLPPLLPKKKKKGKIIILDKKGKPKKEFRAKPAEGLGAPSKNLPSAPLEPGAKAGGK